MFPVAVVVVVVVLVVVMVVVVVAVVVVVVVSGHGPSSPLMWTSFCAQASLTPWRPGPAA